MGNTKYIWIKAFLKHIALIIIVTAVLFWLTLQFFNMYTQHNRTYIVGDYSGLTLGEIIENPQNAKFNFIVIDSVYDNVRKKQSVVLQSPLPNSLVKKNRKIYVTIVASQPEMVKSPNLEDLTVRQAYAVLQTYGLNIGKIEYVKDIGNTIISWKSMGKIIQPNDKIEKGSKIDLVVGNEDFHMQISIPELIGKSRQQAHHLILGVGLNIGKETFINRKSIDIVKVVRQFPDASEDNEVPIGTTVDLWYE